MTRQRFRLGLFSVATLIVAYSVVSNIPLWTNPQVLPEPLPSILRPDIIPPIQQILRALRDLVAGAGTASSSEHVAVVLQQGTTLQETLAITTARVLFGLAVGVPLGIAFGVLLGWSRRTYDYFHPIYVMVRSIPPLALITYIMLWLGHSEAHRLIPIVYAVAATVVIPTYHAVRDIKGTYVTAAQSLGTPPGLMLTKVLLPATSPTLFAGLRYAIAVAWMTAVGAEMLMAENGMGNLLVGGGMWSSRLQMRVDPSVVVVGISAIAAAGWAMDWAVRMVSARLTRWVR